MRKRLMVLMMVLVILGSGLFASGDKEASKPEQVGYDVDNMKFDDVTITIASRYGADVPDEIYFRQKIEEFNAMDNGITVKMDTIPTESDYLNNLRTNFASGDAPNVFTEYGGSRTLDYLESNAILDMTPYFDQYPEWKANFNPSVWDKLSYEGYDGVWGVPFKMYTVVLYYNKDIFASQGLTPPKNWDELQTVCRQLTDAGIKPFQTGEKDVWRLGHFSNNLIIKSLGVEAVSKLADRSLAYDSPEIVKTFTMIEEMVDKGYLGEDILSTNYPTEKSVFAAEGCAMRWDGSWYVSEIFGTPIYEKTAAVPFPYVNEEYKNHAQGGASDMWFISTLNKSQEEINASVALTRYLTSSEYTAGNNEVAAAIFPINFTPTPDTPANPLLDEVQAIADSMVEMRDDIQTYDKQSHMLDTVRAALQGIAMGRSGEECAEEIVNRIKQYD
ncbi:MAG: ABC transporter substrate-binding protein [Clostridia bacterium]